MTIAKWLNILGNAVPRAIIFPRSERYGRVTRSKLADNWGFLEKCVIITKKVKINLEDDWMNRAIRIITDYLWKLCAWKEKYAPQSMDDDNWHPLFCESLDKTSYVEYVLDELLAAGKSEYEELRRVFGKEVKRIEKRLERYAGRDASRD